MAQLLFFIISISILWLLIDTIGLVVDTAGGLRFLQMKGIAVSEWIDSRILRKGHAWQGVCRNFSRIARLERWHRLHFGFVFAGGLM
jgi:hypothetical protein